MTTTTRWTISEEKCLFKDLEPGEKFYLISEDSYWTKNVFCIDDIFGARSFTQHIGKTIQENEKVAKIILIQV